MAQSLRGDVLHVCGGSFRASLLRTSLARWLVIALVFSLLLHLICSLNKVPISFSVFRCFSVFILKLSIEVDVVAVAIEEQLETVPLVPQTLFFFACPYLAFS